MFACIHQRREAAGGVADFLAASHSLLNRAPASASSLVLTRMRSAATKGSRSSHLVEKLLALNVMFDRSISSLNLKAAKAGWSEMSGPLKFAAIWLVPPTVTRKWSSILPVLDTLISIRP